MSCQFPGALLRGLIESLPNGAACLRAAVLFVAVALAGVPVASMGSASRPGAATRCAGLRVDVASASRVDATLICAGARDAIDFLAAQGLDVAVDVAIEVVPVLPEKVDASAVGCYAPAKKRVYLLGYADFAQRKDWFGLPIEPALYLSLAAHEVAHAISGCNFKVERPPVQAWEYVAYVAMMATMAPDLRRRVLERKPVSDFETDSHISATHYYIDPTYFAVASYRHFLRPGNGRAYLHAVLAGKVLFD